MTDTKLLRFHIAKSGFKLAFLAEQLGISRQSLQKKIDNDTEFKASEVDGLSRLLNLSVAEKEQVFFALKVDS